jgi:hypothetical protein
VIKRADRVERSALAEPAAITLRDFGTEPDRSEAPLAFEDREAARAVLMNAERCRFAGAPIDPGTDRATVRAREPEDDAGDGRVREVLGGGVFQHRDHC